MLSTQKQLPAPPSPPPGYDPSRPMEIITNSNNLPTIKAPSVNFSSGNIPFASPSIINNPVLNTTTKEIEATTNFVQHLHSRDSSLIYSVTLVMAGEVILNFIGSHRGNDRGDVGSSAETGTRGHKGRGVNGSRSEEGNKRKRDAGGTGEGADGGKCRSKQRRVEGVAEESTSSHTGNDVEAESQEGSIFAPEDATSYQGFTGATPEDVVSTSFFDEAFFPD
ncbi:MAG: hypothetical protein Q9187_002902 [Circinaria calcarea]